MGQEVLVGVERRRRWSDARKLAIIEEVGIDGLSVSDVARRHDITRQHIYQWRAELRRKTLWSEGDDAGAGFIQVNSAPEDRVVALRSDRRPFEILLCNGRRLCGVEGFAELDLIHLIRVLERA